MQNTYNMLKSIIVSYKARVEKASYAKDFMSKPKSSPKTKI